MKGGDQESKKRACFGNFCTSSSGNCAVCKIDMALDELEASGRIIVINPSASIAKFAIDSSKWRA